MDKIIYTPLEVESPRNDALREKIDFSASGIEIISGGKASLSSVAAAELGGECYVIGRVGNDLNGEKIKNELSKRNVRTGGIMFDESTATGNVTIYVPDNGELSFDVELGANMNLVRRDVERHMDLFSDAAFCLISTELSREVINAVARICTQKSVKLIFNANPAVELDCSNPVNAHILVTNKQNIDIQLPGKSSLESKIGKLLKGHCENLIITIEEEGRCVLIHEGQRFEFAVSNFVLVNHAAGIECFCGALAVALADGKTLQKATHYAWTASVLAMSRKGSIPSLPTQEEIANNYNRIVMKSG
jgi:ribokinase